MIDVPLLDAGQAVGVRAGQDDVRLALEADAALVQRVRINIARQLKKKRSKKLTFSLNHKFQLI